MKSPPPPSVIKDESKGEVHLLAETTASEEIQPVPTPLLSYYVDLPPLFPDILILLGITLLIGIVVGVSFASFALIPLSIEGTFWTCLLHTLLFSILFFSMRATNFPLLFIVSLAGSFLAVIVGHLYYYLVFRSIFLALPEGLNATAWNWITTYFLKAPNPVEHVLKARHLIDWVFLIIESLIMAAVGAIAPFCVFIMHEDDDRN